MSTAANWTAIEDAIYDVTLAALPGLTIRWADQNVAIGDTLPLVILEWSDLLDGECLHSDAEVWVPAAGSVAAHWETKHLRTRPLAVHLYARETTGSSHAVARLDALDRALHTSVLDAALDAAGISVLNLEPIKDLSGVGRSRRESRAMLEMVIAYGETSDDGAYVIDTAVITPPPTYT